MLLHRLRRRYRDGSKGTQLIQLIGGKGGEHHSIGVDDFHMGSQGPY